MNKNIVGNRIAVAFAFCFGLSSLAAAQTKENDQLGQPGLEVPQARIPAHPPVPPMPPGLVPSAAVPSVAVPKPSVTRTVRPSVTGSNQSPKLPAEMKLVAIYPGTGYFDAGLAEKLRPVLAKAFGITPASGSKPGDTAPDLLRSVFGQKEGPENNTNQKSVTGAGQP